MRLQNMLQVALATVALASAPVVTWASTDPLHNPTIPTDVDGNRLVEPRDAELIIALLRHSSPVTAETMATLSETQGAYYYDTTNDQFVSPRDAVLVINHLLTAPEPSSLVLAGLGLVVLIGCARRRRRTARL